MDFSLDEERQKTNSKLNAGNENQVATEKENTSDNERQRL